MSSTILGPGEHHIFAGEISWERSDIWSRVVGVASVVGVVEAREVAEASSATTNWMDIALLVLKQVGPGTTQ